MPKASKRDLPRYNPKAEQVINLSPPTQQEIERTHTGLMEGLHTCGHVKKTRKQVLAAAGRWINWGEVVYCVSDTGTTVTMAISLYTPAKKEGFYSSFRLGPIDMLRDTAGVEGYWGMVAMDEKDKVIGCIRWDYLSLITWMWDHDKYRIENASLERTAEGYCAGVNVCFDIVSDDPALSFATLRPAEEKVTLKPEIPPALQPYEYKTERWNNGQSFQFTEGILRGTEQELESVLEEINGSSADLRPTDVPGIFELNLCGCFEGGNGVLPLFDIIEHHPGLKVIGFLEDWGVPLQGSVLYSESGYAYVTDGRSVGHFDPQNTDPWQREHVPTENFTEQFVFLRSGVRETVRYTFPFRKMWQDKNYYLFKNEQTFRLNLKK